MSTCLVVKENVQISDNFEIIFLSSDIQKAGTSCPGYGSFSENLFLMLSMRTMSFAK